MTKPPSTKQHPVKKHRHLKMANSRRVSQSMINVLAGATYINLETFPPPQQKRRPMPPPLVHATFQRENVCAAPNATFERKQLTRRPFWPSRSACWFSQDYLWAMSSIWSRSFDFHEPAPNGGSLSRRAMVPVINAANHDPSVRKNMEDSCFLC